VGHNPASQYTAGPVQAGYSGKAFNSGSVPKYTSAFKRRRHFSASVPMPMRKSPTGRVAANGNNEARSGPSTKTSFQVLMGEKDTA
jgi:hypothetical protein